MKKTSDYTGITLVALAFVLCLFQGCKNRTPDSGRIVRLDTARNRAIRYLNLRNSDTAGNGIQNTLYYTAEVFTKNDLEAILSESKCDGIRIYHGLDAAGRNTLMIVGVANTRDSLYEDLLPKPISAASRVGARITDDSYNIIEGNIRCPKMCDENGLPANPDGQ